MDTSKSVIGLLNQQANSTGQVDQSLSEDRTPQARTFAAIGDFKSAKSLMAAKSYVYLL